jgi:hypothetical protein
LLVALIAIALGVATVGDAFAGASRASAVPGTARAGIPLVRAPAPVFGACVDRAALRKFPVLCPTRYPMVRTSTIAVTATQFHSPSFYWAEFNDPSGFSLADGGHLILGGEARPLSLAGRPGEAWPRPGQPRPLQLLGLPMLRMTPVKAGKPFVAELPARVLRGTTVERHPGLVLVARADYPTGGWMGGHVIVIWNSDGHGYFVSLHFAQSRSGRAYTVAERVAAALAIARSSRPVPAAPPAILQREGGWHTGSARLDATGCGACVQTDSWASTVPYRDAPNDFPHLTMAMLGHNDLIIQVSRSWQPSAPRWMLERHPLRIERSQIRSNFEGNTTHGRVSVWETASWRNGSFLTVYVYFGSPIPGATAIARAQRELDTTRYQTWSIH